MSSLARIVAAATGAGRDRYRSARRLSNAPSDGRKRFTLDPNDDFVDQRPLLPSCRAPWSWSRSNSEARVGTDREKGGCAPVRYPCAGARVRAARDTSALAASSAFRDSSHSRSRPRAVDDTVFRIDGAIAPLGALGL